MLIRKKRAATRPADASARPHRPLRRLPLTPIADAARLPAHALLPSCPAVSVCEPAFWRGFHSMSPAAAWFQISWRARLRGCTAGKGIAGRVRTATCSGDVSLGSDEELGDPYLESSGLTAFRNRLTPSGSFSTDRLTSSGRPWARSLRSSSLRWMRNHSAPYSILKRWGL